MESNGKCAGQSSNDEPLASEEGVQENPSDTAEGNVTTDTDDSDSENDESSEESSESSSASESDGEESSESSSASESDGEDSSEPSAASDLDDPTTDMVESTQERRGTTSMQSDANTLTGSANPRNGAENLDTSERLQNVEKVLADLSQAICFFQANNRATEPSSHDTEQTWNTSVGLTSSLPLTGASSSIRWDNIKPFPNGVPANKLWEEWNRYIENFEIAATLSNANDPVRRSQLLFFSIGDELQGIVRAAKLRPNLNDANCYQTFVSNIKNYFQSMTDTAAEHDAFCNMKQEKSESAIAFHARLMAKARLCGYSPTDQDRFVRGQLLNGLKNKDLAKTARTFRYDTNFIVQAATRDEAFEAEVGEAEEQKVYAIKRGHLQSAHVEANRKRAGSDVWNNRSSSKRPRNNPQQVPRRSRCNHCNRYRHNNYPCPALDKHCNSCGERGHFAVVCRKKRINRVQVKRNYSPDPDTHTDDEQFVNTLSLEDVLVKCCLGSSSPITFLIDSGADVNVVGEKDWIRLKQEFKSSQAQLKFIERPKAKCLHAYASQSPMVIECVFEAEIAIPGSNESTTATFYVIHKGLKSLLGRSTASDMGLLRVGMSINNMETSNITTEFPKMPGVKIKFSVDKTIPPVKNAYYNVPAAYREAAKQRLEEMESRGIIERVTTAPNWISGMSAVAKGKDDFRLVVNMRAPNRAINREYFRLPLIEEMKIKLHGSTHFAKLDLSNAFYHLELSNESKDLTTFLTENGMYRFSRLMFGVDCAPEIFQREMCRILKDIRNIIVYIDDVLIFAKSLEELRKTVSKVLQILKANNLTLNTGKCEFDQTRIKFLGHELDKNGFHVDESKIKSIQNFREPATVSELRSFLGLASFISPHVKHFSTITGPLWDVITAKSWEWGPRQTQAFNAVKKQIVECCVTLGYFSENDRTILYTDASPIALGAVLVQEDKNGATRIISFASKSLTTTEKKYAQNQREALGAVWAVEHFSFFLLGREFTLRTDAQGVAFILNRTREESKRALTRADGWALRLSPYSYNVEYVRGAENIADSSSRLYSGVDEAFDDDISPWEIATLEANSIQFMTEEKIKTATSLDPTLQEVINALNTGHWPANLRQYQLLQNDLTTRDGMVIKTGCVVIPEALRKKVLEIAHEGHPSSAKLKSILRQRVWWPGMPNDAQHWVESCATCAVNGRPEKPTPMQRIFAPKGVWETIALDFNGPYVKFGGVSILVIVDYKSRYLIARPVKSTNFEHTRKILELFDREGLPKSIKTDNGPPFNGEEYKMYCSERGITPVFSTPLFPQQNGLVEGYMKLVNKAMASASRNKTNYTAELREAVHAHNAATHSVTMVPPEEIMSGRKIKRRLPLLDFEKVTIDENLLNNRDRKAKLAGKEREDKRRNARICRVKPGDIVIVERQTRGKGDSRFSSVKYTVIEENNGNLTLNDEEGHVLKRHVSQTKKVFKWREEEDPEGSSHQKRNENLPDNATRSTRTRRAPVHLQDYVRSIGNVKTP